MDIPQLRELLSTASPDSLRHIERYSNSDLCVAYNMVEMGDLDKVTDLIYEICQRNYERFNGKNFTDGLTIQEFPAVRSDTWKNRFKHIVLKCTYPHT